MQESGKYERMPTSLKTMSVRLIWKPGAVRKNCRNSLCNGDNRSTEMGHNGDNSSTEMGHSSRTELGHKSDNISTEMGHHSDYSSPVKWDTTATTVAQ